MRHLFFFLILLQWSGAEAALDVIEVISSSKELTHQVQVYLKNKDFDSKEKMKDNLSSFLKSNGYYTATTQVLNLKKIKISHPVRWEFFFEGNEHFSPYHLKKTLESFSYSSVKTAFIKETLQNIKKSYRKNGFHFVEVEAIENTTSLPNVKRVLYKIKEHQKVKLQKISLKGVFLPFKKKTLYNKIITYSGTPLSENIFYLDALESGLTSLKNDLNNLGYFKASVSIGEIAFNSTKDKVHLTIFVDVGEPTRVSQVSFLGNQEASEFWLTELLNLRPGDNLNLYKLEEGLDLIEEYYLERGFLNVKIEKDRVLSYSKNLSKASIQIKIQEGLQVLVSKIIISGTKKTKDFVVFKEITFKKDEVLTADKVQTSIENLTKLGFFSNININVLFEQTNKKGTPVEIFLSERKSGSFTTGFGINNALKLTFKTFAALDYKNIAGTGRAFTTRAELRKSIAIDYWENRIFFSYLEPYIFDTSTKARLNLSRSDEIWDVSDMDKEIATIIQSNRFNLILERNLTRATTLYFSLLNLDIRTEDVINAPAPSIEEFIGSLGPILEVDYRNHPFLPTKGSFSRFQIEYATPFLGSNTKSNINGQTQDLELEFLSFNASYTYYKPINKGLYWAQSLRGGYIKNFPETSDSSPFPKSRAFFLGGASTIRGFDPSDPFERIPSDELLGLDARNRVLNIPDYTYYYLVKSELRFPMSQGSSLWGALFYDAGAVQIPAPEYDLDPWRHSIGIGLRYHTPVGPLFNLELAYKLDRKENESAVGMHLSVSSF